MLLAPAFLLAIGLAAACASGYGLVARPPWSLLPLCWVLGLIGFTAGQAIGAMVHQPFGTIGQLHVGLGVAVTVVLLAALHLIVVWYNGHQRTSGE
jgi:hypothetical protein